MLLLSWGGGIGALARKGQNLLCGSDKGWTHTIKSKEENVNEQERQVPRNIKEQGAEAPQALSSWILKATVAQKVKVSTRKEVCTHGEKKENRMNKTAVIRVDSQLLFP